MARAGADILADADVLVPVPLHRVETVAAALQPGGGAGEGGLAPDRQALRRWARSDASRRRGARSASAAPSGPRTSRARSGVAEGASVRGLNVVLVDDVLTSGATANAASRVLLRAGAKRVDVLVFARVVTGT